MTAPDETPPQLEAVSDAIAAVRRHYATKLTARESDRLFEAEEIVDQLHAQDVEDQ